MDPGDPLGPPWVRCRRRLRCRMTCPSSPLLSQPGTAQLAPVLRSAVRARHSRPRRSTASDWPPWPRPSLRAAGSSLLVADEACRDCARLCAGWTDGPSPSGKSCSACCTSRAGWKSCRSTKSTATPGSSSPEVTLTPVAMLRDADETIGREHDPARIRPWLELLRSSLFTPAGMRALAFRARPRDGSHRAWRPHRRRTTHC